MTYRFKGYFVAVTVLFLLLLLPSKSTAGDIINVPSTGASTITAAMVKARPGDTIMVENGKYKEHVYVKNGVTLKARTQRKASINGKGRGTVVTLGSRATIDGFEITNGTIGVFAKNSGSSIINCYITGNWQSGIISVRHLPRIEDNVIVFNGASGFQGWDVRSTEFAITHNTIAFNSNHGISIGGSSDVLVEFNAIAFNERFGIKISDEAVAKSRVEKNNFFKNLKHELPKGNYSFDPAFISPRIGMNFKSDTKQCCKIKADDNTNLGSRN